MSSEGDPTTIYQSLLQTPLFVGVSIEAAAGEFLLFGLSYVLFGLGTQMLVFLILSLVPLHYFLVRMTAADPDGLKLALASIRYWDFCFSHGRCIPELAVHPRPSLPKV